MLLQLRLLLQLLLLLMQLLLLLAQRVMMLACLLWQLLLLLLWLQLRPLPLLLQLWLLLLLLLLLLQLFRCAACASVSQPGLRGPEIRFVHSNTISTPNAHGPQITKTHGPNRLRSIQMLMGLISTPYRTPRGVLEELPGKEDLLRCYNLRAHSHPRNPDLQS